MTQHDEENPPSPPLYLDMVRKTLTENEHENYNRLFASWYDAKGRVVKEYTFGGLWQEAGRIAYHLRVHLKLSKKDRVVLCYDFGLHFLAVFLGCLRAGVTAVLVYPPSRPLEKSVASMKRVFEDCQAVAILCDSKIDLLRKADKLNLMSKSRSLWPESSLFHMTDTSQVLKAKGSYDEPMQGDDLAFLQYTSGSTGDPKGVMISHTNLHANVATMLIHFQRIPAVVGFSWLPQYHDAGLLCYLNAVARGMRFHYMSPITFIQNPLLWFRLIHRHRVNFSLAPDFAYNLVCRRFSQALEGDNQNPIPGLDLSCVHSLVSCAEPVRAATVERVTTVFGKYGLQKDWLVATFGMAESVAFVSCYYGYKCSIPRDDEDPSCVSVGCLSEIKPHDVTLKIVSPDTNQEVKEGETGELWINSPSVALGYLNKPELTKQTFQAMLADDPTRSKYLRTGDHAFIQEDNLYICGRIKDLVIVNGVNKYPQDIEDVVQNASPAVRPGCVAAFSVEESEGNGGGLVVVFEIRSKHNEGTAEQVCNLIQLAVSNESGLKPERVVAIAERQICKTTSGKIRRKATREALHGKQFRIVASWTSSMAAKSRALGGSSSESQEKAHPKGKLSLDQLLDEFLGQEYDPNLEWNQLGVTSLTMVELGSNIAEACLVTLPNDTFEVYRTPGQLKAFVQGSRGMPFETNLPPLESIGGRTGLSWHVMTILQGLGILILLFLFTVPVIPAYYVGQYLAREATVELAQVDNVPIKWSWAPVALPTWMASFTILIILAKWIVVGRYRQGTMSIPSYGFLRWWFVDRAMHLWEFWVGRFILNTPFIWLFYRLIGARIHPSAKIDGFIREMDLVSVEEDASLEQQLRCRKFGLWKDDRVGPTLTFRPVVIHRNSRVRGMVSPGSAIGESSVVEPRTVIPEGAEVPSFIIASGNPGFSTGEVPKPSSSSGHSGRCMALGVLKLLWLATELYIFYGTLVVGQFLWISRLPITWRITPLCFWLLLLATSTVISTFVGVILKWIFIGKRKPGPATDSLWRDIADWAADYHFRISISLWNAVASGSVVWNLILKMYGMDIDFTSKVYVDFFPPSKVDLFTVRRTFISFASFDTKSSDGEYKQTKLTDSSLGFNVHVGPGVRISKAVVKPCAEVSQDLIQEKHDYRFSAGLEEKIVRHKIFMELAFLGFAVVAVASFLPSYFLYLELWENADLHMSLLIPIFVLALCVQSLSWIFILRLWQSTQLLFGYKKRPFLPLYIVYLTATGEVQKWSMLPLLWGTPYFGMAARLLGATVKGRSLYFGRSIHDFDRTTIADKAVVDFSFSCGHTAVYFDLQMGRNVLSGLYHEMTFNALNAEEKSCEKGPWRPVIGRSGEATM